MKKTNKPLWLTGILLTLLACNFGATATPPASPPTDAPPAQPPATSVAEPTVVPTAVPLPAPTTWDEFCTDPRTTELGFAFGSALEAGDAATLASLASTTGITVYHNWWNERVQIADVGNMLDPNGAAYNWGVQDGSGLPINGTFADVIYPQLLDVVGGTFELSCFPDILAGPTAGLVQLPEGLRDTFFISLHRPAPAEQELDWRTWVVGIRYENGVPVIFYLVQFQWEI